MLIEPQLRKTREGLSVARTPVHRSRIGILSFFDAAEVVKSQTCAVGRLAVIGALFLSDAIGVERLIQPVPAEQLAASQCG